MCVNVYVLTLQVVRLYLRCEFSTFEETVQNGSCNSAPFGVVSSGAWRDNSSHSQVVEAIPSESRKTDKVILDRTYFA